VSKFLQTTNRTIAWFKKTLDNGELEIKPPFQRNPVWTMSQKSYLIDSILNGYPVPEIYMQELVGETGDEQHIVIDGQQRIRACMEYVEGRFQLSTDDSPTWAEMSFEDLSGDDKKKIFSYTFIVRMLPELPDEEIRGIFQRLNRNVVALNKQELRQATYWGPFISTVQELANYGFWASTGIFTPANIRRMLDVEFVSEIAVAVLHGHQNKKETLDEYYRTYEIEFEQKDELVHKFQTVIGEIEQILPDIKNTRWRKKSDFYTLFVFLADREQQLPLSSEARTKVRASLLTFGRELDEYLRTGSDKSVAAHHVQSYAESVRASSDIGNRKRRDSALAEQLSEIFGEANVETLSDIEIRPEMHDLFAVDYQDNDDVDEHQ
jgi:hypothetical protein